MTTGGDRVSVIIPAFNAAPFIEQTLSATLAQTYPDLEIIVVDDASADATPDIVRSFGDRIKLVSQVDQRGVSAARNTGAAKATGTWLAFLDADDWWPPTFVEDAVRMLRARRALCYDNILVEDPPGIAPPTRTGSEQTLHRRALPWKHELVDRTKLAEMFDGAPLLKSIVRREDFQASGGFDPRFRIGEDFHYHVKLVSNGVDLVLVDEPYGFYRTHAAQATAATSVGKRQDLRRHVQSCRGWITMYETMPRELKLDPASLSACRKATAYWRYRFVRGTLLLAIRGGQWHLLANAEFLRNSWSAIGTFAARKRRRQIRVRK